MEARVSNSDLNLLSAALENDDSGSLDLPLEPLSKGLDRSKRIPIGTEQLPPPKVPVMDSDEEDNPEEFILVAPLKNNDKIHRVDGKNNGEERVKSLDQSPNQEFQEKPIEKHNQEKLGEKQNHQEKQQIQEQKQEKQQELKQKTMNDSLQDKQVENHEKSHKQNQKKQEPQVQVGTPEHHQVQQDINPNLPSMSSTPVHFNSSNDSASITDPDAGRLHDSLDKWTVLLKQTILSDFLDAKAELLTKQNELLKQEKKVFEDQLRDSHRVIETLKEDLNKANEEAKKQSELVDKLASSSFARVDAKIMVGIFELWRARTKERHYDELVDHWVQRHYIHQLGRKVLHGWSNVTGLASKKTIEKLIRRKVELEFAEIEKPLRDQISQLTKSVLEKQEQLDVVERQRQSQQQAIRQAFMRGVSALNFEAINLFKIDGEDDLLQKMNASVSVSPSPSPPPPLSVTPLVSQKHSTLRQKKSVFQSMAKTSIESASSNTNQKTEEKKKQESAIATPEPEKLVPEILSPVPTSKPEKTPVEKITPAPKAETETEKAPAIVTPKRIIKIAQGHDPTSSVHSVSTQKWGNTVVKVTRHQGETSPNDKKTWGRK